MNIDSIKGLINKEALETSIDNNSDGYGGACVNVAINVMKYLDNFNGEFNIGYNPDMTTPHGIICKCDDQGGITGFMAGAARNIIANCHILGWKFYIAAILNEYNINNKETLTNIINSVVNSKLTTESKARIYIDELIQRFKSKKDKN
jgi:hypothetical protein